MRLNVRKEQIEVMQAVAEANFERRLAVHLRSNYPNAAVKLPEGGEFTVGEMLSETLDRLIRVGIEKAKRYEVTRQSSIAGFVAIMFDVAPNFDEHRLCEVLLSDEERSPNDRVEEIAKILSEKNWDSIRNDYDPDGWLLPAESSEMEEANISGINATKAISEDQDSPNSLGDLQKTVSGFTKHQPGSVSNELTSSTEDRGFDTDTVKIDRNG